MKMLLLGLLLVLLAISAVGAYLVLEGGGTVDRPYQPNRLDRAFPAWRRSGGAVMIAVIIAILLIEWRGLS